MRCIMYEVSFSGLTKKKQKKTTTTCSTSVIVLQENHFAHVIPVEYSPNKPWLCPKSLPIHLFIYNVH